jgi:hypothetical protein
MTNNTPERDTNPDPITGAPGAHPVGVGLGAAGAAATGAAIGTAVGGPVGAVVGGVVGAVAGGLAGKGVAEAIDPTAEDAYWRENHGSQPFGHDQPFDAFAPAYRTGYEGFAKHSATGSKFEDAEPHLQRDYETHLSRASITHGNAAAKAHLTWDRAKHASKAAWDRVKAAAEPPR